MKPKSKRNSRSLPHEDKLSDAENAFLRHAQKIMQEYNIRKDEDEWRTLENKNKKKAKKCLGKEDQPLPPYKQAEGFLKRECYALLKAHLSYPQGKKLIQSIVRKYVGEPRYPSFSKNPFYWGLLAADSADAILGAQRISRLAKQLYYAHNNNVPAQYLVGFLYQIRGSVDLEGMLMRKGRDPSLNMEIPPAGPASGS